jgi:hypothetical protein
MSLNRLPRPSRAWPGQTMVAVAVGFNGATSSQTWNRSSGTVTRANSGCFNGATSSRTWNRRNTVHLEGVVDVASMGPRPLRRGIEPLRPSARGSCPRFNGATSSQTWNRRRNVSRNVIVALASMGPRPLRRGIGQPLAAAARLRHRFNGATSSQTWNRRRNVSRHVVVGLASMGPRPLRRGIGLCRRPTPEDHAASMGPRPLKRGIEPSGLIMMSIVPVLQWGHVLSDVEYQARRSEALEGGA